MKRLIDNTMTVQKLIEQLQQFDSTAEVVGTFEGIITPLTVYQATDGCIMVDVDIN